jgi:hypothetical protein
MIFMGFYETTEKGMHQVCARWANAVRDEVGHRLSGNLIWPLLMAERPFVYLNRLERVY